MTSDNDLCVEIRAEIARQRGSRADAIDVQVLEGIVTLTGTLPSDLDRWNLRDAVIGMAGVKRLIDETMTAPDPSLRSSDSDIAKAWFPPV